MWFGHDLCLKIFVLNWYCTNLLQTSYKSYKNKAETALPMIMIMKSKQIAKLVEIISDKASMTYGVPHGSVLSPTLFLLYINVWVPCKLKKTRIIFYADDADHILWARYVKGTLIEGKSLITHNTSSVGASA